MANAAASTPAKSIALQIVLGLVLLAVVYWISLRIMRTDTLVMDAAVQAVSQAKRHVKLLDGYLDFGNAQMARFNATQKTQPDYVDLGPSVNRQGGLQFTYSFWLHLPSNSSEDLAGKILFFRGDRSAYTVTQTAPPALRDQQDAQVYTNTYAIHCPLVRFGQNARELVLELNTLDAVKATVTLTEADTPAMALLVDRWMCFTFVVQDNQPVNDFENGVQVLCYVNQILAKTATFRSAVKTNTSGFHLCPPAASGPTEGTALAVGKIGHLSYYNYALEPADVDALFHRGQPTYQHSQSKSGLAQTSRLGDYTMLGAQR
jgi:hypothetical protein